MGHICSSFVRGFAHKVRPLNEQIAWHLDVIADQFDKLVDENETLRDALDRAQAALAAPPGIEPGSPGFKGPSDPRPGAIVEWFSLPIALRKRWWLETDYGRLAPSADLAAALGLVPPGGVEPPSPP